MAGIAAAILGAGVIGAGASLFASSKQQQAQQQAIAAQQQMFNQAAGYAQPFISAGQQALPTLQGLITPGANQSALLAQTPGFQFANQMAQQGVTNQGTATGLGGNTLLAGANAGSQLAMGMAWQPTVNALQNLVGTGAGSAQSLGGQAVQTGQGIGANLAGIGNAQAGASTAVGSNIGNSITGAAFAPYLQNILNSKAGVPSSQYGSAIPPGTLGYNQ